MDLARFLEEESFQPIIDAKPVDGAGLIDDLGEALSITGAGGFANGLFWLDHPDVLRPVFDPWVNPKPGITMVPFGRTAFGNIFYVAYTDEIPPSPGILDVHYKTMRPANAANVEVFFNHVLRNAAFREHELQEPLFDKAREAHGPLAANDCYYYVPALALGGSPGGPFDKGDWSVHLDLLRQM